MNHRPVTDMVASSVQRNKEGYDFLFSRIRFRSGCILIILSLFAACGYSSKAAEPSLQEFEKRNIDKIVSLTAAEKSTILFTLADHIVGLAVNGKLRYVNTSSSGPFCQYPHPALSHDGLHIAFVSASSRSNSCSIEIYDICTNTAQILVETKDDPGEIAWSWDDARIAYLENGISTISTRDGSRTVTPLPRQDENGHELGYSVWNQFQWLRDDSGFVMQLDADIPTKHPGETTTRFEVFVIKGHDVHLVGIGSFPSIAPTSGRIALYSKCRIISDDADGGRSTVLLKNSWAWTIVGSLCPLLTDCGLHFPIVWSPDAGRLFYGAWVSEDYRDQIYLLDVKTGRSKNFLSRTSIRIKGWH